MNMSFPSREQVASIRKNYPLGTRVMLNNMLPPLLLGTDRERRRKGQQKESNSTEMSGLLLRQCL